MLAKTDPFNKRNKNGTSPQYIDITVISSTIWTDYTLVDFNMNTPHEAGRHWFLNPKPLLQNLFNAAIISDGMFLLPANEVWGRLYFLTGISLVHGGGGGR